MFSVHQRSRALPRIAHWVAEIFSPFVLVAALLTWVAWLTDPDWLITAAVAVLFVALVPLTASLVMVRQGKATDKFIRHRRQRHAFYAISLVSILIGAGLIFFLSPSAESRLMAIFAAGTLLVVMAINLRVKLSIHALMAALSAIIFSASIPHVITVCAATAIWFITSWSRVYLSRHSLTDVLYGSALGVCVGFAFLWAAGGLPSP